MNTYNPEREMPERQKPGKDDQQKRKQTPDVNQSGKNQKNPVERD